MTADRQRWITETQMFQRIAGTPESSAEELGKEWDSWKDAKRKARELKSIETLNVIQSSIIEANKEKKS